jgi:transcriptional regulator with XRE-family HTH domain
MDGIGARIREIRTWRRKSLSVIAGLAGISESYLSRVERGERPIDKRSLVEAIASALQVAPSELLAQPFPATDPVTAEAHAAIEQIGTVLLHNRLGHPFRAETQPWRQVEGELRRFLTVLVPTCDYLQQAELLPALIENLYTAHAIDQAHRRAALDGLVMVLGHTAALLKNLGAHGLPSLAAMHMRYVADELEDPAWAGAAEWRIGQSSGDDRTRMLAVSVRAANQLQTEKSAQARQAYGMLHLNAALACAALLRRDDAYAHLAEARDMLKGMDAALDFADMHFGTANWAAWRVAVGVELGEGPAVMEHARGIDLADLPAAERRGMFYGDLARGLAQDKKTRKQAISMLRVAEEAAPQRVRTNPFLRETVLDLMRQTRRDAAGRDLRGLAYRMGIAG